MKDGPVPKPCKLPVRVADPYHFDTDPDLGCEKNSLRIRIQGKMDKVPGKS